MLLPAQVTPPTELAQRGLLVVHLKLVLLFGYSYSKRTTLFESTITPYKSKTIIMILTLLGLRLFVVTISIFLLIINSTSNALYINQMKMTGESVLYLQINILLTIFLVILRIGGWR